MCKQHPLSLSFHISIIVQLSVSVRASATVSSEPSGSSLHRVPQSLPQPQPSAPSLSLRLSEVVRSTLLHLVSLAALRASFSNFTVEIHFSQFCWFSLVLKSKWVVLVQKPARFCNNRLKETTGKMYLKDLTVKLVGPQSNFPEKKNLEHSRSRKQPRESGCEALLHLAADHP